MVPSCTKSVPVFYVYLENNRKHRPPHISCCKWRIQLSAFSEPTRIETALFAACRSTSWGHGRPAARTRCNGSYFMAMPGYKLWHIFHECCKACPTSTHTDLLMHQTHAVVSYPVMGPSFPDIGILHPHTSIFTDEAYTILAAAKHIKGSEISNAVIYKDSLGIVKTLKTILKYKNPAVVSLYSLLCAVYTMKQHVVVCWVPGHREIEANVLADKLGNISLCKCFAVICSCPRNGLETLPEKKLTDYWQRTRWTPYYFLFFDTMHWIRFYQKRAFRNTLPRTSTFSPSNVHR